MEGNGPPNLRSHPFTLLAILNMEPDEDILGFFAGDSFALRT